MSQWISPRRTPSPGLPSRKHSLSTLPISSKLTSVSSGDAKKADLLLTNNAVNPPVTKVLKEDIDTSTGSYKLEPQTDITTGATYRFRFIDSNTTGILSESAQFTINKVATEKPKPSTTTGSGATPAETSAGASSSAPASGAEKVGAWGMGGLLVAAGFAALL
jgi:hypothetical protein